MASARSRIWRWCLNWSPSICNPIASLAWRTWICCRIFSIWISRTTASPKFKTLEDSASRRHLVSRFECVLVLVFHPTIVTQAWMKPSGKFHTFWFGLAGLGMLDTLNLAANKFEDVEKLKGLSERPSLRSVDVSSNYFEDGDALVNFWESNLPNVQCLYLHHNPCSRQPDIKNHQSRVGSSRWCWVPMGVTITTSFSVYVCY